MDRTQYRITGKYTSRVLYAITESLRIAGDSVEIGVHYKISEHSVGSDIYTISGKEFESRRAVCEHLLNFINSRSHWFNRKTLENATYASGYPMFAAINKS